MKRSVSLKLKVAGEKKMRQHFFICCWNLQQVKFISNLAILHYFSHYNLYQVSFSGFQPHGYMFLHLHDTMAYCSLHYS